jgi:hypothetical protein
VCLVWECVHVQLHVVLMHCASPQISSHMDCVCVEMYMFINANTSPLNAQMTKGCGDHKDVDSLILALEQRMFQK